MRKWIWAPGRAVKSVLARGIAIFLGSLAGSSVALAYTDADKHAVIQAALISKMNELNSSTPVMIDKITRLDNVNGLGWQLTYTYTIVGSKASEIDKAAINTNLRPYLANELCTSEAMKVFFDNGVPITYVYRDDAGAEIGKFRYTAADCRRRVASSKPAS
ncbi:hypothetical protein AB4Y36_08265 [Paraburkholderia sp. BR10936]|uniref:hypothetical protein n=1 Tax=Paraburkholderia sp. BR10936 TaxID=3236993 RepID=UPI0034D1DAFA